MSKELILDKLNQIFCEEFDDLSLQIREETVAKDVEGWDSFAQISLVMAIEEEFSIKFTLEQIVELKNVGEIVEAIKVALES